MNTTTRFWVLGISTMLCLSAGYAESDWNSQLAAGLTLTDGNSDTMTLNAALTTERLTPAHEFKAGVEANYGESEVVVNGVSQTDTTTQKGSATINYKHLLNGHYLYTDNVLFHDKLADLDLRLTVGLGAGLRVVNTDSLKIGAELGAAYIHEELATDLSDDKATVRVALRHDQTLSETAKCWSGIEYLPNVENSADYLLNGEVGLETAINPSLSLRLVAKNNYDSEVPAGRERNDLSVISSLVLKL